MTDMGEKGLVSILMAVYNCEKTLSQAIDSVLAQTYNNWKFIICDDCSTDGTLALVESYAKRYPQKFIVLQNKENSKLAYSLNHCLKFADGEFCARMDGDDYCSPDRLEKQVAWLNEHSEYALVGTAMQVFGENGFGRVVSYKEFPDKYDLRFGPCFAHATIMMRTEAYRQLGGYTVSPRTVRSQDYDLWFRFFAAGYKGAMIKEPLYFVREDEDSFLRRKPKLYLWATVTRYKGFTMNHFPLRYYWRVLLPLVSLMGNEVRKISARLSLITKGQKQ